MNHHLLAMKFPQIRELGMRRKRCPFQCPENAGIWDTAMPLGRKLARMATRCRNRLAPSPRLAWAEQGGLCGTRERSRGAFCQSGEHSRARRSQTRLTSGDRSTNVTHTLQDKWWYTGKGGRECQAKLSNISSFPFPSSTTVQELVASVELDSTAQTGRHGSGKRLQFSINAPSINKSTQRASG